MSHLFLVSTPLFLFSIRQLWASRSARLTNIGLKSSKEEPKQMEKSKSQAANCPICRSPFKDRAMIDGCQHEYCFDCIVRWAQFGHRDCPYCRRSFDRVKHNIRSETDFDWHWTDRCAELGYRLKMLEQKADEVEAKIVELEGQMDEMEQKVDQLEKDVASWNVLVRIRALWRLAKIKKELAKIREMKKRFNDKASEVKDDYRDLIDLYRRHLDERG